MFTFARSTQALGAAAVLTAVLMFATGALGSTPKEAILYSFQGGDDGSNPVSGLVADQSGNLYGTTTYGGSGPCTDTFGIVIGCGTVFELVKPTRPGGAWKEIRLYNFEGPSGTTGTGFPMAGVVFDSSGNLYGTTFGGTGAPYNADLGTVFKLSPPTTSEETTGKEWTKTTLHAFIGGPDGANPRSGVIFDKNGNIYGSTSSGAPICAGTVFRLVPPSGNQKEWTETVLYAFSGGDDGQNPAGIVLDSQGNIYGTTSEGGGFSVGGDIYSNTWIGGGTIFELTPPKASNKPWNETQLFLFPPCDLYGEASGGYCGTSDLPVAGLVFDSAGNLYGTSELGAPYDECIEDNFICAGNGTIFQLARPTAAGGSWTQNILYTFGTSAGDGAYPMDNLISDHAGNLYGTLADGCSTQPFVPYCYYSGAGQVVELSPSIEGGDWTETVLYSFIGGDDGSTPMAGLLLSGTSLYSTTEYGGTGNCPHTESQPTGCGTVFAIVNY